MEARRYEELIGEVTPNSGAVKMLFVSWKEETTRARKKAELNIFISSFLLEPKNLPGVFSEYQKQTKGTK